MDTEWSILGPVFFTKYNIYASYLEIMNAKGNIVPKAIKGSYGPF